MKKKSNYFFPRLLLSIISLILNSNILAQDEKENLPLTRSLVKIQNINSIVPIPSLTACSEKNEKKEIVRQISAFSKVHIFNNYSEIRWTKGPQTGKVYFKLPCSDKKFTPPKVSEVLKKIDALLPKIPIGKHLEDSKLRKEILNYLFHLFHEPQGDLRAREAIYFSYDEETNKFLDLYLEINEVGIATWLRERGLKIVIPKILKEYEKKLISDDPLITIKKELLTIYQNSLDKMGADFAPSRELTISDFDTFTKTLSQKELLKNDKEVNELKTFFLEVKNRVSNTAVFSPIAPISNELGQQLTTLFYGEFPLDESKNKYKEIFLTHGTYDMALVGIFNFKGLASPKYTEKFGVEKIYLGESGRGNFSMTADYVSFYLYKDGNAKIVGGFGPIRGFEVPILFGLNEESYNKLKNTPREDAPKRKNGSKVLSEEGMKNEVRYPNFVSIDNIQYLFAPDYIIPELKMIFEQNGYSHIKILPLRQYKKK